MNKNEFRSRCLARLKGFHKHQKYICNKHIMARLEEYIVCIGAKTVLVYLPLESEVDIVLLIRRLRRQGVEVLVPLMEGSSFRLVKYRLPLSVKKFGVKEPKYSKQYIMKTIDIAVVPIVGVDASFRRIGFGKGMYDRFFSKHQDKIKKVVFIQRELCYCKEIVTDDYDIKADLVITHR